MRRFFLGLWTFTAVAHVVVLGAIADGLGRLGAPGAPWIALAITALLVAVFRRRLSLARDDRPISRARRAFELAYFAHWCGSIAALLLAIAGATLFAVLQLAARLASRPFAAPWDRLCLGAYGIGLALGVYGVGIRARRARVRTLEIQVRGLDRAFDGYRIVHLSDLHVGALFEGLAPSWIARTNALAPDLVALTGDYVTSGVRFHERIADVLAGLRAKDAVIATLGNHDYFGGGEPLATLVRERGVVLLRNERRTIARGSASIEVAGVDDTWTRRADLDRALRGFDGARPLVGLTHDPSMFPDFARRGAALVLAGHTHWGQIGVPFAAERANFATRVFRFSAGLYRDGEAVLYVSPGLGTTGPPIRLGSPPEITLLVLRAA